MKADGIWVGWMDRAYVIRFVGDVRLNLCISFDDFIATMFAHDDFVSVIFDLRETQNIDSTTLGLMAKIACGLGERGMGPPVAVTRSPSIVRLLESMGFDDVVQVLGERDVPEAQWRKLAADTSDEGKVKDKVLEAHRILGELSQSNRIKFKELIETLEGIAHEKRMSRTDHAIGGRPRPSGD